MFTVLMTANSCLTSRAVFEKRFYNTSVNPGNDMFYLLYTGHSLNSFLSEFNIPAVIILVEAIDPLPFI
jgi:hypothetical protein